ncbi:hypothetical protein ABMA28_001063 [Loxostege sticticalis]|uniref:Fork-head domain-containing protein n=1 Tax=Loxostege sticticalis TaxID=481309 RepID=A0ABD0T4P9_LOXSC
MSLQGSGGFQSPWSSQTGLAELDGAMGELEPLGELTEVGFEPQTRARSNTWPLPRPENYVEPCDETGSKKNSNQNLAGAPPLPSSVATKKNSSRRNAWGNLSYADLITQAITSAPENRLTLSQIYEWMVQNVPYFKDKGDSNSSAGWKRYKKYQPIIKKKNSVLLTSSSPLKSFDLFRTAHWCYQYDTARNRCTTGGDPILNAGLPHAPLAGIILLGLQAGSNCKQTPHKLCIMLNCVSLHSSMN